MSGETSRLDQALVAEQAGDLEAASLLLYRDAMDGNPAAKLRLGKLLLANATLGEFLESATADADAVDGGYWFRWAASEGLAEASLLAGDWSRFYGDSREGMLWYIDAARQGVATAVIRAQSYLDEARARARHAFCVGDDDSALGELRVGIFDGDAWALATHTWLALVREDFESGLRGLASDTEGRPGLEGDALERCRQVLGAFEVAYPGSTYHRRFEKDFADARCFAALLGLAAGNPPANSVAIWEDLALEGHSPSALFLAVSALRAGDREEARSRVRGLTNDEVSILRDRFVWPSRLGSKWIALWAKDCDEALQIDYVERFS